jgi:hypothetical protein
MLTRERRVRHLRLACRREEHARQGRIRLEDALRTASLGDEARLIVVRRLDLGTLPLQSSATEWSRRVEQRFQQLRAEMVSVDHPSAAGARVVYFSNASDPWLRLAARVASGQTCQEWFWTKAAPGWIPHLTVAEALRLAFRALVAQSRAAALVLVRRLAVAGRAVVLLRALEPEDVFSAVPGAGAWPQAIARTGPAVASAESIRQQAPPRWLPPLLAAFPPDDARALLAVAAACAENASLLPPAGQLALLALTWRPADTPAPARPDVPTHANSKQSRPAFRTRQGRPDEGGHEILEPSAAHVRTPGTTESGAEQIDRVPTAAGGLFFLVRLFEIAGEPNVLRERPDLAQAGLPWRLLRGALRLARSAADDALWVLPNPVLPLPLGALWRPLLRAHHQCRRLTTLSLRDLVRRPALVSLTETHVDVFFRPGDADMRIRRAGLDVDPGWVPWLQRVIAFHYDRED